MNHSKLHHDLTMYFQPHVVDAFAEHEQNQKNYAVAHAVDLVMAAEIANMPPPLFVAELGGGAHPDRYNLLFTNLLQAPQGHIDWVDVSSLMLEKAHYYLEKAGLAERKKVITFIEQDIVSYLETLADETLDLAVMKYTFEHLDDLDKFFFLLARKLKKGGKLVATLSTLNGQLRSFSTNARFLHNGQEFPLDETRQLHDGDTFTVRFYKVSGDPVAGYLEGAETTKYYHAAEKIQAVAEKNDLSVEMGDWKQFVEHTPADLSDLALDVLVGTKL